ncbi:MAG: helix-turn-helix transcriptional regulator [Oscillospiraceae bacterium]|nr:helix-turn-helix transcriptional regulator [Oscillospiraceae bacterium]
MTALYDYRHKAGMTQEQLAKELGVTPSCVTMWENGNRKPDIITLKKLAHILGCTADDLLEPIEI